MADFTPITTQEDFDRAISARISRERETVSKQFQSQLDERDQKISGFEQQIADLNKKVEAANGQTAQIAELQAKVKGYETSSVKMRIAREVGLPYEIADRLSGEDEKSIREDAETMKKIFGVHTAPPLRSTDDDTGSRDAALKDLLASVRAK